MYSVTQVTESGTPVLGVALSNGQRRKGRCRRGVGTGPFVFPGSSCRRVAASPTDAPMPSLIVNRMHNHVALLTDYGLDDEFVGVLKSVITDMAPHVRITDITQDRKSTRLNSSHVSESRMPSSA